MNLFFLFFSVLRCFGFSLNKVTSVFMFSADPVHVNEKTLHWCQHDLKTSLVTLGSLRGGNETLSVNAIGYPPPSSNTEAWLLHTSINYWPMAFERFSEGRSIPLHSWALVTIASETFDYQSRICLLDSDVWNFQGTEVMGVTGDIPFWVGPNDTLPACNGEDLTRGDILITRAHRWSNKNTACTIKQHTHL